MIEIFIKYKKMVYQFIKFGIVGLSNTAISLLVYYFFIWLNKDLYIIGNVMGFIVSVVNAFYWNNRYVFTNEGKNNLRTFLRSCIIYTFTFLLSTILLFIWVNKIGILEEIAPLINLCITIPLNFLLNKFWAFK